MTRPLLTVLLVVLVFLIAFMLFNLVLQASGGRPGFGLLASGPSLVLFTWSFVYLRRIRQRTAR